MKVFRLVLTWSLCHSYSALTSFIVSQVYEVIRPLVNLLHTDREGMQNYEALRGLTNLAGFSEKLR